MDETTPPRKTVLESLQTAATIFSLVAVPIIVAVVGFYIQRSSTESAAKSKITELAIEILKEPPGRNSQPGLRAWAVEMLESTSDVSLSDDAKRELSTKPLFPMQPVQKKFSTSGMAYIEKQEEFESYIGKHLIVLDQLGEDFAIFDIDKTPTKIYMNDSILLEPDHCVLHLLGFDHTRTKEEISTQDDPAKPLNSAFTAWVCP